MSWKPEIDGIEQRRRRASEQGGAQSVARQHGLGRLTIRERIERLADPGSLREQGPIAGYGETDEEGRLKEFTPANYILAMAEIDGRRAVLGGEDFTLRGGSPSAAGLRKSVYAEDMAIRYRVPLVRLLEGGGGSVTGPKGKPEGGGGDPVFARPRFKSIAEVMSLVPVVSAALGPVAGFPAARFVASHFSIMTRQTAQIMVAGPAVVERALGETKSKDQLGAASIHGQSGVADNVVENEDHAFEQIRAFLSYLPPNVFNPAPKVVCDDDPARFEEELLSIVPRDRRQGYDIRRLVGLVVDKGSAFELAPEYGRSQITALARLNGLPVGVLANDSRFYAGAMSADGAQKVTRFFDLCDQFGLPIVSFVDEPGFAIGEQAEREATIRYGTAAIFAANQTRVPWASIIVRKAYGVAAAAHFGPDGYVLSWPSAETGALPVEGGVAVAFRRHIAESENPEATRRELEEGFASMRTPFPRAEAFGVHDLIDPRLTRRHLSEWASWIEPLLADLVGVKRYAVRP